ncbi:MAG: hypothetical protein ACR2MO_03250 [Acidimicrobiales bacterium]
MDQGDGLEPLDARVEAGGIADEHPPKPHRLSRVALWCALTAVLAAAVAVVVLRNPARTPEQDLARVRDFVTGAVTGQFEGTSRSEYGSGADEPGSTSIDVSRVEGSFDIPDRVHTIDDGGEYVVETIVLKAGAYFREGDSRDALGDEPWVFYETGDEVGGFAATSPSSSLDISPAGISGATGVLGALGAPFDLGQLLVRLGDSVQRVSPGVLETRTTLRELLPADIVEEIEKSAAEIKAQFEKAAAAAGADAPEDDEINIEEEFSTDFLDGPVTIRLRHAPDGRLDELTITAESGKGEDRSVEHGSLTFSHWGEPVQIGLPDPADVDLTPGIDEDDIAAFTTFPLVAPQSLPDGFLLQGATVEPEDAEIETCTTVSLGYGPPRPNGDEAPAFDTPMPLLDVGLTPASCQWTDDSRGYYGEEGSPEPIQIGAHAGQLWRVEEDGFFGRPGMTVVHVRITVGQTVVDAYSNLPQDKLVAALASLGPLDLASQPVDRLSPPPGD